MTMLTKTAKLEAFVAVPELKFEFHLQFLIILSKGRSSGPGRFHRGLLQRWKTSLQSTVTSLLTSATNKYYTSVYISLPHSSCFRINQSARYSFFRWRFIFSLPSMQSLLPNLNNEAPTNLDSQVPTKNINNQLPSNKTPITNHQIENDKKQEPTYQPAMVETLAVRTLQRLRKLFPSAAALR